LPFDKNIVKNKPAIPGEIHIAGAVLLAYLRRLRGYVRGNEYRDDTGAIRPIAKEPT